jgi:hypothetical protein
MIDTIDAIIISVCLIAMLAARKLHNTGLISEYAAKSAYACWSGVVIGSILVSLYWDTWVKQICALSSAG